MPCKQHSLDNVHRRFFNCSAARYHAWLDVLLRRCRRVRTPAGCAGVSRALWAGRRADLPVHGALAEAQRCGCAGAGVSAGECAGARLVIAGPDEGMLATLQAMHDAAHDHHGLSRGDGSAGGAGRGGRVLPARDGRGACRWRRFEALAAGLPVILSPGCNLPEAAAAGAGLIVEPEVEPLAACPARPAGRCRPACGDGRSGAQTGARAL